ncbi:MAG: HAMP domain-containing histidine kinase [Bacteroidales bacterium]|nr:HAMP domain-containing histidine kinase [Bacteroidales bacterium]
MIEKQKLIETQKRELLISNEQLSILNTTKDKLFSVLGHDLKAPFNVLLGFGALLLQKIDIYPPEKIKKNLQYMNDAAHTAFNLLENLLNWARAQRGIIEVYAKELNINHLIDNTLKVLNQQAQTKNITFEVEIIGCDEEVIFVDEVLLGTILRNIISNSIKFSNINGRILLKVIFKDNLIEFSVADQGVGIPNEIKEKLFKISNVTSKQGTNGEKGTGLGLLVCSEFVSLLKGKIWVESELNVGTTFYFTIPV